VSSPDGYVGTQSAEDRSSEYNAQLSVILELLSRRCHVALVRVISVEEGLLSVQPMVNQRNGDGTVTPHGAIDGIPYFTLQAGGNAVTMVPEVGDNGLCVFADRDISSVKANKEISNPGSLRQCDWADGLYLGGFLNAAPTQYVDFSAEGIHIHSPTLIKMTAPDILFQADASITMESETLAIAASDSVNMDTGTLDITSSGATTINASAFNVNAPATFSDTIDAGGIISAPDVLAGGKSGKTHTHRAQGATAIVTPPL
jgi:hypothetical protein